MGQLSNISEGVTFDRFMHPYDVVGLVHTGVYDEPMNDVDIATSHTCVYMRNRPLSPQSGGHAIFVRKKLAKHVSVVADRIEHGSVWIQLHCPQNVRKSVFIGFVYLPPQGSTYYTQVNGMSFEEHMVKLQQDIMFFQDKGQVIIMGDMNARTGTLNEWDLLDPHILRHYDRYDIKERKSKDKKVNSMGRRIISICKQTKMYMLNGRAHSDPDGAFTYKQLGGKGRSSIDYAIVSRDIIQLISSGLIDMTVPPFHVCPNRISGSRYDHCPVVVSLCWSGVREGNARNEDNEPATSMRWRPQFRDMYTDIVQTDGEVLGWLSRTRNEDVSVTEACEALMSAIYRAAEVLHSRVGGVFVKKKQGTQSKRVRWLSQESREIRRRMKEAERNLPHSRNVVQGLRCMYRKQVKVDRRTFLTQKRDDIKKDMIGNVKKFWARFRKGRGTGSTHTVSQWSEYFSKLFNEGKKDWGDDREFQDHCDEFEELFGAPAEADVQKAESLNREIQWYEVEQALKSINLGKAVGYDNVPAEFFRQAYTEARFLGDDGKPRIIRDYLLTPYLTALFNKILIRRQYPTDWAVGVVTPVPKPKGDSTNMDNFRAITVGSAISKIFAQVLMIRIDDWAETNGWRAATQFGFRKGLGTTEAVFMLRHLVDKADQDDKPLYTTFVDFKKAYDSVPRELLWKALSKIGIHGEMMDILQQMYRNVRLQVKVNNSYGADFESSVGVKQGDPLSPLLFGLYIDRFTDFLKTRCPNGDITCAGNMTQLILYADDLVLLSHDPILLQKYIQTLELFCQATGMSVNVAKTEVVIFFKKRAMKAKFYFNHKLIKEVREFVYLGVVFHNSGFKSSVKKAVNRRADKAKNALFGMMGTCRGLRVHDIQVLNTLMDGTVVPSAVYGSEIWGPDLVNGLQSNLEDQALEEVQWLFLRMALWVGKPTPHVCMLKETGRRILACRVIENTIGFWNKVATLEGSHLIARVMKENVNGINDGWSQNLNSMVQKLCGHTVQMINEQGDLFKVDEKYIKSCTQTRILESETRKYEYIFDHVRNADWSKVRACPDDVSDGFKAFKYNLWFQAGSTMSVIMYVQDIGDIRTLARFRCGVHWLATEVKRSNTDRSERKCPCCHSGEREDELHVFFCDAYEHIKSSFPALFNSDSYYELRNAYLNRSNELDRCMNNFVNKDDKTHVNEMVGFLRRSIRIRKDFTNV